MHKSLVDIYIPVLTNTHRSKSLSDLSPIVPCTRCLRIYVKSKRYIASKMACFVTILLLINVLDAYLNWP